MTDADRRPIATRRARWPHALARGLTRLGVTPNQVSTASVACALAAAASWIAASDADAKAAAAFWVLGALAVQARLVCNLLDGLMAIECGRISVLGELFNDVPDRVSDPLILVAAGYAGTGFPWSIEAGWAAALAAVLTSYVRFLGASLLGRHDFVGPFAKPQRMFVVTLAALGAGAEAVVGAPARAMPIALVLVTIGSLWTAIGRLLRVARALRTRSEARGG